MNLYTALNGWEACDQECAAELLRSWRPGSYRLSDHPGVADGGGGADGIRQSTWDRWASC